MNASGGRKRMTETRRIRVRCRARKPVSVPFMFACMAIPSLADEPDRHPEQPVMGPGIVEGQGKLSPPLLLPAPLRLQRHPQGDLVFGTDVMEDIVAKFGSTVQTE